MHLAYNIAKQIRNRNRERGFVYLLRCAIDKFIKFIIEKRTIIIYKRDLCCYPPQEMMVHMAGKLDLIICDRLSSCDILHIRQIAETSELSQKEIEDRFHNGDICFLVKDEKGTLVHFSWVCFKKRYIEYVDYLLKLKEDEAFVYNCYTFEKYRGLLIYPWVLTKIQEFLKNNNFHIMYIDISLNNISSAKGAKKSGFEPISKLILYRVFRLVHFLNIAKFKQEK